jgi:iron complex transport system ATP-binding protein
MSNLPALTAQRVSIVIGENQILSDVDLHVKAGEVVGILGPSGAGNSTLLKVLSGQLESQNCVSWNNKTLADYDAMTLAQQIAVVNQLNDSVFALNLYQIVRMGLLPHKSLLSRHSANDEQSILDAIDRVGLAEKAQQSFSSLSGGEQQRGLIARALVQKAALIVLDEPVNHLDVYYQHQVLKLLQSLAHDMNITVVMSLHDMNLAANYCDQLCLLNQGRVIAQGTPNNVLNPELLTQVFRTPCEVTQNPNASLRVDFYPPTNLERQAPESKQSQTHE